MEKIKLLLVEDDEHFHNLLVMLFAKINKKSLIDYTLDWISDGTKIGPDTFENCDAVLLDYNLGEGLTGIDVLRDATEAGCRTPIIFLTGQGGRKIFREARENGAAGYLIKQEIIKVPFTLETVVHFAIENANQRELLRQMATLDGLTGLLNHGEMQRRLDAEIARSNRHKHPLSVILLDIDHFKSVNDTHGHPAGDSVLKWLTAKIRHGCRKSDIVARYGGEEFLVILPETGIRGAMQKAEKLRREIASVPFEEPGLTIPVTSSFGVTGFRVGDTKQILLKRADEALYEAKKTGRNKVVQFVESSSGVSKKKVKKVVAKKIKLLVVDDDQHMLNLYDGKLSGKGYDVVTAISGEDALKIMHQDIFDVVLLDQTMPDMNGVETLERITKEIISVPPVIMITAADSRHLAVEFMKIPAAADFTPKPVSFDLLEVQIESALETRSLQEMRDKERAARIAAEEIGRLKDVFLAQMSHEFKTPLDVIHGFVELAKEDLAENGQNEDVADALKQIKTASQQLRLLVDELFQSTQAEFGAENFQLSPVEMLGTLRNVGGKAAIHAEKQGLLFKSEFEENLPPVLADPERILLVLNHLLDNAVKFTQKGEIGLEAVDSGDTLRIDITDTGIGIAPENQEKIFNRFTRLEASGHLPGAGMGLYLARFWTEKMNGRIWVDSEPGTGTTFHVSFPVWKDYEAD